MFMDICFYFEQICLPCLHFISTRLRESLQIQLCCGFIRFIVRTPHKEPKTSFLLLKEVHLCWFVSSGLKVLLKIIHGEKTNPWNNRTWIKCGILRMDSGGIFEGKAQKILLFSLLHFMANSCHKIAARRWGTFQLMPLAIDFSEPLCFHISIALFQFPRNHFPQSCCISI